MNGSARLLMLIATSLASSAGVGVAADGPGPKKNIDEQRSRFDRTVAPLLASSCLGCHNATAKKGQLDLSAAASTRAGGKHGAVLVPGRPDESLLWQRVEADEMPPKSPLSPADKATIKAWIASGANWGTDPIDPLRHTSATRAGYDWWSLRPVKRPEIQKLDSSQVGVRPIDALVLAKLEAQGMPPAPDADRRTLIRRLSFDLLGLPPTPEAVDAFVNDRAPDSYERLVDRYLDSPHFGVRWARHWLDLVRFGETQGFEYNRPWPNAWRYRDWVVEAFNDDLPYDQFVRLQLAGDVLAPDDPLAVVATGQLVVGPYDQTMQDEGTAAMRAAAREEELEGIVGTTAQVYLGLTLACARCHDHKFDPVRQEDYYRFAAALGGVRFGERETLTTSGSSAARARAKLVSREIRQAKNRKAAADPAQREPLIAELAHLEARERLLRGGLALVVTPRQPEVFHVLARGDYRQPGKTVNPGGIAAVGTPDLGLAPNAPDAERRKALARWVTDPRNPLAARVIVNRLWQHHFGVGLVETPNDFGFNGARPSNPELLDWLASELVQKGWSLKAIHRAIVTSDTYRRSSRPDVSSGPADAGNRLLRRREPRRLEAEALRDAVLAVSDTLDTSMGGPGYADVQTKPGPSAIFEPIVPTGPGSHRRSLYRTWVRAGAQPMLDALDCPDPSVSTPKRTATTTPLQALALLNDTFMLEAADAFAARVQKEAGRDVGRQVERAYRLAFARMPDGSEASTAERFVAEHGMAAFCLALFNANEFLFID